MPHILSTKGDYRFGESAFRVRRPRVEASSFGVLGFRVSGLRCWVSGLGIRV